MIPSGVDAPEEVAEEWPRRRRCCPCRATLAGVAGILGAGGGGGRDDARGVAGGDTAAPPNAAVSGALGFVPHHAPRPAVLSGRQVGVPSRRGLRRLPQAGGDGLRSSGRGRGGRRAARPGRRRETGAARSRPEIAPAPREALLERADRRPRAPAALYAAGRRASACGRSFGLACGHRRSHVLLAACAEALA